MLKDWQQHLLLPLRQKESASKIQVPRPDIVKIYNKGIGGVELINQKAAAYNFNQNKQLDFICVYFST